MAAARPRNMYTEEKLRPAVAAAVTLAEVLANLGLEDQPERRRYVSGKIRALGIATDHFHRPGLLYTDEALRAAVATCSSMVAVATSLGAQPVGGTIHHLRRRITALGLDTSHFAQKRRTPLSPRPVSEGFEREGRKLVVNEQLLREAVPSARSIAEVIHMLGLETSGPRHRAVRAEIDRLGLDTSHFLGQAHRLGTVGRLRLSPENVLVYRADQQGRSKSTNVRRAMLAVGVPEVCGACGTGPHWRGLPMTLEVDHISGDFRDNRRENLRFLCPNCHATTDNYCRKKQVG